MKAKRRNLMPASDILLKLFQGGEAELAGFLLRHSYFISPDRIRQRYEKKGSARVVSELRARVAAAPCRKTEEGTECVGRSQCACLR